MWSWLCDYVVRFVMEKNWALSVDQCQVWVLEFSVYLIDLVSILLKCHDFTRIQKGVVDHTCSRLPNSDCDPFLVQVWLWEVLWSFSWSSQLAGCCWLSYKIHFSLHVTIQSRNGSLLLCRVREDSTSKWQFWCGVKSQGTHLPRFFTFPICFKCWMTIEWSMWSSLTASHIVVRGSAPWWLLSVSCCQLPEAGHCIPHHQGSHFLCKTSWTTTVLCVC